MRITKSLLILTIAILAAAIILFLTMQKPPSFCSKVQDRDTMYLCLGAVQNDISFCQRIQDESLQYVCYDYSASQQKNGSICDLIQNLRDIDNGPLFFNQNWYRVDKCYYNFILKEDNPYLCSKLKSLIFYPSCWEHFAFKTANATLCEEIQEPDYKNSCYAKITSNISYCDKIASEEKDRCYVALANQTQNVSICETMHDWKILDTAYCYENAGFCNLLQDDQQKIDCFASKTGNVSYCDSWLLDNLSSNRNFCYVDAAIQAGNTGFCGQINDEGIKSYCYNSVAQKLCNPSLCDIQTNQTNKDKCFLLIIQSQCMLR